MTGDQLLLCLLLGVVVVMLVTEWVPLEVTALLTMSSLALTGLVSPQEALDGFSNPAVVTIWAVFILSGGLDRTGVADHIGTMIQRCAGRSEIGLITALMLGAGIMSAFMNNVAVAALLLPVTMDLARRNHIAPSRLLLPLAYGSLLGGLTTMIGTPPNILVSTALREAGLEPFRLFDFTPIGGIILIAGTGFMVFGGRLMLPRRDVASAAVPQAQELTDQYELQERTFALVIPPSSPLDGMTLAGSRLGAAVGLNVIAIYRQGRPTVAPHPSYVLAAGDSLFVQGRLESICDIQALTNLIAKVGRYDDEWLQATGLTLLEIEIPAGSPLAGHAAAGLLEAHKEIEILALRQGEELCYESFAERTMHTGDTLLILAKQTSRNELRDNASEVLLLEEPSAERLQTTYLLDDHLICLELIDDPDLADITMDAERIESILGVKILTVIDPHDGVVPREPGMAVRSGSQFLALEASGSMQTIQGLASLRVDEEAYPTDLLETGHVGLVEAVLAPRSGLGGKSLRQLQFRERFGLGVLAIWRAGRAYRSNLRDMPLEFGDALLLFGPLDRIQALGGNHDIIVLSHKAQLPRRTEKAPLSALIMTGTLLPVLFGIVPIHLAVVVGAAGMVMAKCLSMEEAYRAIEWRAVFLIAGLLPLGVALEQSGMATLIANQVVAVTAGHHPIALLTGLVLLTFLATCIIPTAALVLLMAPIALNTAAAANLSPHALLMAISMAASASFLTPIAHPANILVMGPGGYRFRDYMIIGLPLTLVVFVIIVFLVPIFWPMTP